MLKKLADLTRLRRMTPHEYQAHVLVLLRVQFSDLKFDSTPEPFIILYGEAELGLQNLYSHYALHNLGRKDRDDSIREHFSRIISRLDAKVDLHATDWASARPVLRVQLMPPEYSDRIPVLTFEPLGDVAVALVLDFPDTYGYVCKEDSERWGISSSQLYEIAISNLEAASSEVEAQYSGGADRFLAVAQCDGYDAARILLPSFRRMAVERLGAPCFGAIPNRDFLFFWSTLNSPEFHSFACTKITGDNAARPYPLTPLVFEVSEERVVLRPGA